MNILLGSEGLVGYWLLKKGFFLATAESCTGGLIGHLVTNVAGSSEYFLGGVVAYSNEAKEHILSVRRATLDLHGAVSRETALEMAQGVRNVFAGDVPVENVIGLSVTGIAGPGGEMPGKPVGLVWVGLSSATGDYAWSNIWQGDREENKDKSACRALELLLAFLKNDNR